VATDAWSSSHAPAGPAVWKVQKAPLAPEITFGFDHVRPPSPLCASMIGDET
jgi:hypothetical protein